MIRLLVVGQSGIELDGKRLTTESDIVFGMLLYLAARAGEAVQRDEAQQLFWPELPHSRGRHCLRQAAYRLRQLGVPLRSDNESLGIALGDVTSDFAPLVEDDVPAAAYRGLAVAQILPGYQPAVSTPFAGWVEEFRSRIALRIRQGLVRTIVDLRSKGRYREAEPLARACLTADPFNEVATLTLAEATAVLSGNRAEAVAILDRFIDEIGESSERRLALSASILRRRISERFVEQRYAAPPEPPLVGREDVLQLMVEKVQEAVAGRSTVAYVWGEPGIGKTRLLDELTKVAHVQGVRVERYTVSPNDSVRPLALFSSLLPRLINMSGALGVSTDSYAAIQRFIDPSTWERVDPPQTYAEAAHVFGRLKTGICELFEVLSEEQALAVFVDDVHWADERSIEVLCEIIEHARLHRIAFVLTSRVACGGNSSIPLLALCARAAVRRLDGLAAAEVERLLQQIADQRNFMLTNEFVRRTVETSAGNPLFVSELATHYVWNGLRDDLPHNMQSLLQKRLESLSAEALLVFQTCAVLGEHTTVERLGNVLQIPTHSLLKALTEVECSALIGGVRARIACRHELLSAEALRTLTPIAREALNRKAAVVLEEAAVDEMNTAVCWHAVHAWLNAAQPGRALRLVRTMAGNLLSSGLAQDADSLLTRARELMLDDHLVAELLPLQLRAARARGDLKRSLDLAVECHQLTQSSAAQSREAHFAEFAAFDASRGLDALRPRLKLDLDRLEASVEQPDVLVELALRVVIGADDCLDPVTAHRCFDLLSKRRTLARASSDRREIFQLVFHSHFGNLDVAVARARAIVAPQYGRQRDDISTKARRLRWAHRPLFLFGCCEEALLVLDQSIAAAKSCGSTLDEVASACYRIDVLIACDRLEEALLTLAIIDKHPSQALGRLVQTTTIGARAELLFALGRNRELRTVLQIVNGDSHPREHTRTRLGVDSLHILQSLLEGQDPDPERIDRIMRFWHAVRGMGSADTIFLAACGALLARRAEKRAVELCREYRIARRERWPIPRAMGSQFRAILAQWGQEPPVDFNKLAAAEPGFAT